MNMFKSKNHKKVAVKTKSGGAITEKSTDKKPKVEHRQHEEDEGDDDDDTSRGTKAKPTREEPPIGTTLMHATHMRSTYRTAMRSYINKLCVCLCPFVCVCCFSA